MSRNQIGHNYETGDIKNSTVLIGSKVYNNKNRFVGIILALAVLGVFAVLTLRYINVSPRDLYALINPPQPSAKQVLLNRVLGTYSDGQQTFLFSPNQMFNMDGTIYVDGEPVMFYRLIDESHMYLLQSTSSNKDAKPITYTVSDGKLEIQISPDTKLFLTKTSDRSTLMP